MVVNKMNPNYTAKIYCDDVEIAEHSGDNVEQLYLWMLAYAEEVIGELHGEITDNRTHEIAKQFKKRPIE